MERECVKIYDTTLRDGLRNSGIVLSLEQIYFFAETVNPERRNKLCLLKKERWLRRLP